MKLNLALQALQHESYQRENERRPMSLAIPVYRPGAVGGTPRVMVSSITAGFDWDSGMIFLNPESPLTTLTPEDLAAIRESVSKGQSWHAYQAHQKLTDKIRALELEVASLKQASRSDL
jgi:hypothetical protein